jgi:hypothetical protein
VSVTVIILLCISSINFQFDYIKIFVLVGFT